MTDIRTVGVAGSGTMGAGIAIVVARAGFDTIVFDKDQSVLDRATRQTESFFQKSVERKKLTQEQGAAALARFERTTRLEAMARCDVVIEAVGLAVIAAGDTVAVWATGSALFGAGTAMAYPTLLAAVGDVAHPSWRGAAVGVYRLWRDLGFAVGAVLAGVLADMYSLETAIGVVAAITAASGVDVAVRMLETHLTRT
jgi:threonine dehydrogenase-like Zn-dependent dehydrogenase